MEHSPAILHAKELLFLLGIILGVGTVTGFIARRLKIPDVVMFLLAGMALGNAGLGVVNVSVDSTLNQLLLIFGSCYILFDGGASVRLNVLKGVWPTLLSLATVGVLISAVVTAFAAQYLLHLPFIFAMLLGAVIASTDPATLVPVFRQVKVRAKVAQTVMSESAFNDAMGAILTFAVLGVAVSGTDFSISANLLSLLQQSLLGLVGGAAAEGGGAENPQSEARNPKQIRIARNRAMDQREARTFLRRRRASATVAVQSGHSTRTARGGGTGGGIHNSGIRIHEHS